MGQAKKRRAHCAYCGAPAVSVDHVPPRSLFPGDKTNLITVPSCEEHNGKKSGLDEKFRNYVATHIGDDTPEAQALLAKTVRAVSRNKSAQKWRPDLSAFEVGIKSDCFKPMIEWITRGLYWHYYKGDRLPLDVEMRLAQMRNGPWLSPFISDMNRVTIATGQFCCTYNRMIDYPTVSVWVYLFHRRLIGMAMTDEVLSNKLAVAFEGSSFPRDSDCHARTPRC